MTLSMMSLYADPSHCEWFQSVWKKTGKKLDMGKSCIRFKRLEAIALDVIGQAIRRIPISRLISLYEAAQS